jgi:hypothetical protein
MTTADLAQAGGAMRRTVAVAVVLGTLGVLTLNAGAAVVSDSGEGLLGATATTPTGTPPLITSQASNAKAVKIKPGAVWTIEANFNKSDNICEVETFEAHHSFRADLYGDVGTYKLHGKKLSEKWTGGESKTLTFTGKYKASRHEYVGKFGGYAKKLHASGQLVPGSRTSWMGETC